MLDYDLDDFDALARWLNQPDLPDGALGIVALEGYLAAIATHAPHLPPEHWLPPIWGFPPGAAVTVEPRFGNRERLVALVIALHEDWLQHWSAPSIG